VRPFFAFRGTNDEQILALVQAGLGITVMPASYSMKGVARPRLAGFNLQRQIGILYAAHADHFQHAASPMLEAIRSRYSPAK
jgi:DNA-binding transcriptional LysR family regulator